MFEIIPSSFKRWTKTASNSPLNGRSKRNCFILTAYQSSFYANYYLNLNNLKINTYQSSTISTLSLWFFQVFWTYICLWMASNTNDNSDFVSEVILCPCRKVLQRNPLADRMEVLKSCKLAMRLGNLSRRNGFHLWKWRIPNFIIDLILLLPMAICSIQMVIFCYNNATTLKTISNATYLWLI